MNYTDKEKAKRITGIFNDNFAITRMYAWYLEMCPELISREMIDELTRDSDIIEKEAIVAILAELFGIDVERDSESRRLYREYLTPSVRLFDAEKYKNNPYYKNIKINDIKDGRWELKNECYPAYRGVIAGDMIIKDSFVEIPPLGFFKEDFYFPAVLEDGNEWMTLTPVDLDTSEDAIEKAHGKVITFGLGLGYYVYMVSQKASVESITVIEKSTEVIDLFKKYILPQFPNKEKVVIVNDDAYHYAGEIMPNEHFDLAFVDIYRDASDGAPVYREFKKLECLNPTCKFMYWIENFLISRCRAERLDELIDKVDRNDSDAPRDYSEFVAFLQEPLS